jgi:hypothetical protein
MKRILKNRPSPAMAVALTALFVALGGTGYAAIKLPSNSVGAKQIKKSAVTNKKLGANAVTSPKVKNGSLTAADINLATLPKVPTAANADHADNATHATNADTAGKATTADTATNLAPAENWHEIGASGEPGFAPGAQNTPSTLPGAGFSPAAFYKDKLGTVHLKGLVTAGTDGHLFALPPGYRPGTAKVAALNVYWDNAVQTVSGGGGGTYDPKSSFLLLVGSGVQAGLDGMIVFSEGGSGAIVALDGISYTPEG